MSPKDIYDDSIVFCDFHVIDLTADECSKALIAQVNEIQNQREFNRINDIQPLSKKVKKVLDYTCPRKRIENNINDKVEVFWHIGSLGTQLSVDIVEEQYLSLKSSGLLSKVNYVLIYVGGDIEPIKTKFNSLQGGKQFILHEKNESLSNFEFTTLSKLQNYCMSNPQSIVLYFHNKGASRNSSMESINIKAWRKYMEHFIFNNHEDCINALKKGDFDTCGVQLTDDDQPHYSGNFWFARCDYVNELPLISESVAWDRHVAETWVTNSKGGCYLSRGSVPWNPYYNEVKEEDYVHFNGCIPPSNV